MYQILGSEKCAELGPWVSQRTTCSFHVGYDQALGLFRDGVIVGGVVYSEYTGVSIEVHVAGFGFGNLSRDFLWAAFDFPFNQLKCNKVFAPIMEKNEQARRAALKIGFHMEARLTDRFRDGDCLIFSMYRSHCPWLSIRPRSIQGMPNHG